MKQRQREKAEKARTTYLVFFTVDSCITSVIDIEFVGDGSCKCGAR